MSYAFWCSRCKKDHAGECPPAQATTSATGLWPARCENGQRFRWADGIHTIDHVNDDRTECVLLLYGDRNRAMFGWRIIDGCRPAGCLEFIS